LHLLADQQFMGLEKRQNELDLKKELRKTVSLNRWEITTDGDYRVYVSKNFTIDEALEDVKTIIDRNHCSISISYSADKWHSPGWKTFYLSVER